MKKKVSKKIVKCEENYIFSEPSTLDKLSNFQNILGIYIYINIVQGVNKNPQRFDDKTDKYMH